jgi:S1-C subfamily serine protease
MKPGDHEYQLLDHYHKGLLSPEEIARLQERINTDDEFKKEAEAYLELIGTVKFYGERQKIRKMLEDIHEDVASAEPVEQPVSQFKKYWRMSAVAASVIIATVVGTLLTTQSLEKKQTANYKELRRNVEQIKKSQKLIMDNLAESQGNAITPGKYSGTGFLISANGYVATSYHVIKESDSISIENEIYGRLKTSVVYSDAQNDISILKIETPDFKVKKALPFMISRQEADLGEYVYTLGFPREDIVFGEGSVSASTGFGQNPNAYQVSVPVNPGNSGAPLLNTSGDLIGMVSGVQTETAGAAFAVKSSRLLDLVKNDGLDSLPRPLTLPRQNMLRSMNRVQQIKRWKEFVFMVRVYKGK